MIVEAIAMVSAPAATALGVYNAVRWAKNTVAEKRRKAKAAKTLVGQIATAVKFAKGAYDAVSDGIDEEEAKKIKAIAAKIKEQLADKQPTQ